MTEFFDELAVVGDPLSDEDGVIYILASLPESLNVLVTELEANARYNADMSVVTERSLYEELILCESV